MVVRATGFRWVRLMRRAVVAWHAAAVWKIHMFKCRAAALRHFHFVLQAKYLAHMRFSLFVEKGALRKAVRHLQRLQMRIALHGWMGRAVGVVETHWDEFEQYMNLSTNATRLQAWWRGWVARRLVLEEITMKTISAIKLQAIWRGKASRLELRRLGRRKLLRVRCCCCCTAARGRRYWCACLLTPSLPYRSSHCPVACACACARASRITRSENGAWRKWPTKTSCRGCLSGSTNLPPGGFPTAFSQLCRRTHPRHSSVCVCGPFVRVKTPVPRARGLTVRPLRCPPTLQDPAWISFVPPTAVLLCRYSGQVPCEENGVA
jgi:hypothetical protein